MATNLGIAEHHFGEAMKTGDAYAARALVSALLDQGVAGDALVRDLLAPAQRAMGLRWQRAEATVADEHTATAVADAALGVIESNRRSAQTGGHVFAVTCAESEWHTLPARMAAQRLREAGVQVRFLGPSMPADHLREYLARLQPAALVLSATMPTSLPGAARSIEAAHDAGVPVITGGAGFGPDDTLSRALGGDAWASDAGAVASISLPRKVADPSSSLGWSQLLTLEHAAPALTAAAYERLLQRVPGLEPMTPAQAARTREDLTHILSFLAVSRFVGDDRILRDFTSWLLDVLQARGVPPSAVRASYSALADELSAEEGVVLRDLADEVLAA